MNLNDADAVAGASNQQLMDAGRNMYQQDIDVRHLRLLTVAKTLESALSSLPILQCCQRPAH